MGPQEPGEHTSNGSQHRGLAGIDDHLRQALAASLVPRLASQVRDCLEQTAVRWRRGEGWSSDESAQHWANVLPEAIGEFVREFETAVAEDIVSADYPPAYSFSGVGFAEGHVELRILGEYESTRRELRYQLERVLRERDPLTYATLQRAALIEHRFQYPNWAPWTPLHWFERLLEVAERHWGRGNPSLELMRNFVRCMADSSLSLLVHTVELLERHGLSIPAENDASGTALPRGSSEPDPKETDKLPWTGLDLLAHSQRVALSRTIIPSVIAHLEACLRERLAEWSRGETRPDAEDPRQWAARLDGRQETMLSQIRDSLRHDIEDARYPPSYSFSGVGFAASGTQLRVLGDYESTRRSLRHELEASLRANHRHAYAELRRAALHEHRFQYPNWAPWSPLHWYERLMEISESAFGRSAQTLELMRGYTRCLDAGGDSLVTQTLEAVDSYGLLEGAEEQLEQNDGPERSGLGRGDTWADYAPEGEADAAAVETESPGSSTQQLTVRMAMPAGSDDVGQWTRWMTHMAARLRGSLPEAALAETAGSDHDNVAGPPGFAGIPGTGGGGGGPSGPGTAGGPPPVAGGGGEDGAVPQEPAATTPPELRVIARDLLRGMLDRILDRLEFHPKVASVLDRAIPALGDAVCSDFAFLMQRQHPLRRWMGEVVNVGLRFDPDRGDLDHGIAGRYFGCLQDTVDALQSAADELDGARKTRIPEDWNAALERIRSDWEAETQAALEPMLERERLARARRSLTTCALAADATLPSSAAEAIVAAWADVLSVEAMSSASTLGDQVRAIVQAILERAEPSSTNPLVQSFLRAAQDAGVPAIRLRAWMGGLAEAHRQTLRGSSEEARFDPRAQVRERSPVRDRDDDPDLLIDRADTRVFEASHLRLGDWFEFIDKSTGRPRRLCLVWHGEASRSFLFFSLDGESMRKHSLQGIAHELREGRLHRLPQDNPLDAILR
jgi:hypothetical protein